MMRLMRFFIYACAGVLWPVTGTAAPDYTYDSGAGGGVTVIEIPLSYATPLGPTYSEAVGAPDVGAGQVGSVHRNTTDDSFYYKTSAGWQGPVASPGAPLTISTAPPASWDGADGDYWVDRQNLVKYGPKADFAWPAGVEMHSWTLIEVAATPVGGDGAEGSWAWRSMGGGAIRLYGPKLTTGWPTAYLSFTGIDEDKISFATANPGCSAPDVIRIMPGSGTTSSNCATGVMPDGGYTLKRTILVEGDTLAAGKLILGAEIVTVSNTGTALVVSVVIDTADLTSLLGMSVGGVGGSTLGLLTAGAGSVSKAIIYGSESGGVVKALLRVGPGLTGGDLGEVTSYQGTLKIYAL